MSEDKAALPERLQVIAIDGPVASGKTAVGRAIAERLGWTMLDTGVMYRALTWVALQRGAPIDDPKALTDLARNVQFRVDPPFPGSPETSTVLVDGVDSTPHLRKRAVEANVSPLAAVPGVRERMVELQRRIAQKGRLVMVGRDIGTVVVPDAAVKIYLDASAEVRAARRAAELRVSGRNVTDEEVLQDLHQRDAMDAGRATSPLRADAHADILDASALDLESAVEAAMQIVTSRLAGELSPCPC